MPISANACTNSSSKVQWGYADYSSIDRFQQTCLRDCQEWGVEERKCFRYERAVKQCYSNTISKRRRWGRWECGWDCQGSVSITNKRRCVSTIHLRTTPLATQTWASKTWRRKKQPGSPTVTPEKSLGWPIGMHITCSPPPLLETSSCGAGARRASRSTSPPLNSSKPTTTLTIPPFKCYSSTHSLSTMLGSW